MFVFGCFLSRGCVDCLSWLFLWLIYEIVFRVCFDGLFFGCFWLRDFGLFFLIVWLFRLVVFCWTVVIWWGRRKIKVWRVHCDIAFVKSYVKMRALWFKRLIFWFGVYFLLWKRFLVLNVVLRMTKKLNRLPNSDGYCSCVEENAAGCSVLF